MASSKRTKNNYDYEPKKIHENENLKLYWDRTIMTDRTVKANRPDITILDKRNRDVHLIDIAVPNTDNCIKTIASKTEKYRELAMELQRPV